MLYFILNISAIVAAPETPGAVFPGQKIRGVEQQFNLPSSPVRLIGPEPGKQLTIVSTTNGSGVSPEYLVQMQTAILNAFLSDLVNQGIEIVSHAHDLTVFHD